MYRWQRKGCPCRPWNRGGPSRLPRVPLGVSGLGSDVGSSEDEGCMCLEWSRNGASTPSETTGVFTGTHGAGSVVTSTDALQSRSDSQGTTLRSGTCGGVESPTSPLRTCGRGRVSRPPLPFQTVPSLEQRVQVMTGVGGRVTTHILSIIDNLLIYLFTCVVVRHTDE